MRIGGGVAKGEWRCKVCKFKNESIVVESDEIERCTMCKEPKSVMKEQVMQMGAASQVKGRIPKVPPSKMHVEERKNEGVIG